MLCPEWLLWRSLWHGFTFRCILLGDRFNALILILVLCGSGSFYWHVLHRCTSNVLYCSNYVYIWGLMHMYFVKKVENKDVQSLCHLMCDNLLNLNIWTLGFVHMVYVLASIISVIKWWNFEHCAISIDAPYGVLISTWWCDGSQFVWKSCINIPKW